MIQNLSFLVNDQRDAHIFFMYLFLFVTIYMFRAHRAHHQERQIVSIQPLVSHFMLVVEMCAGWKKTSFDHDVLETCIEL